MPQSNTLKKLNDLLSMVVLVAALYIIVFPVLPSVSYWARAATNNHPELVKAARADVEPESIPKENTVVLPSIQLQQKIYEGSGAETLNEGVWRRPHTSIPPNESNTVLVGHRFTYDGPAVFYHLDKIKTGDDVILYWEGKKYEYQVMRVQTVAPSEVAIEADSTEPLLTIYTCTPLWTAENRLVIQARLKGEAI